MPRLASEIWPKLVYVHLILDLTSTIYINGMGRAAGPAWSYTIRSIAAAMQKTDQKWSRKILLLRRIGHFVSLFLSSFLNHPSRKRINVTILFKTNRFGLDILFYSTVAGIYLFKENTEPYLNCE